MRTFLLISSTDPLIAYYSDGFARFSPKKFDEKDVESYFGHKETEILTFHAL